LDGPIAELEEKIITMLRDEKENDRELTDAEVDTVSGGLGESPEQKAAQAARAPHDDGKLPTLPCDWVDILCRLGF
jgi:hypothetical protein